MELRYKKLQAKVKDGVNGLVDQMKQGKTLMIEFSVENVQVRNDPARLDPTE
jgi:hypothetical protein